MVEVYSMALELEEHSTGSVAVAKSTPQIVVRSIDAPEGRLPPSSRVEVIALVK